MVESSIRETTISAQAGKFSFTKVFIGVMNLLSNFAAIVYIRTWTGRKAGFEFKLGERGLGYYRTGKTVRVPSNTAY